MVDNELSINDGFVARKTQTHDEDKHQRNKKRFCIFVYFSKQFSFVIRA